CEEMLSAVLTGRLPERRLARRHQETTEEMRIAHSCANRHPRFTDASCRTRLTSLKRLAGESPPRNSSTLVRLKGRRLRLTLKPGRRGDAITFEYRYVPRGWPRR